MATLPKSVIIVGGSIAGLLHGVYLKRNGTNVTILEQDANAIRSSHNAGICFGPSVQEFLRLYDDTGIQSCQPGVITRLAYRQNLYWKDANIVRHLTSWGLLYRILRANFDGFPSEAVTPPPVPRTGDGKGRYLSGKKVTSLQKTEDGVVVSFVGEDGMEESFMADLVIGADGLHSTVRSLVQAPMVKEYSGYISWRGTVCEADVSPGTAGYFQDRTVLGLLKGTYIVCYIIPPDAASFVPGTRLINWVWYCNLPETPETNLEELLTDSNGHVHTNTVPSGLVRPEVWKAHLAEMLPLIPAPFAELFAKTENPFVTKVNDALCSKATFLDGRVLLVGDALSTFRPHFAVATEQAARHCLGLGRVWKGEMTLELWEKEAVHYAIKMWLGSRVIGAGLLRGWSEFLFFAWEYVMFFTMSKIGV
ncbi:hypothetical protein B0T21DRAFT_387625 [Apiosordaria backusii]|uniref:2,6-dihydroxypyridine 3-monooxygenase substrate binding domain-containing protein n=1 Tax=Apiosordaria backusii TaxID=314023 RepID=A0AA40A468_9PEZI|nr:hypothetical protein B0T21DRAFT_387625 [Apiosordaria backusii]